MNKFYHIRPSDHEDIAIILDHYFPELLIEEVENPFEWLENLNLDNLVFKQRFFDKDGNEFYICYTEEQLNHHLERNCGMFMPYMPMMVCLPPIEDIEINIVVKGKE